MGALVADLPFVAPRSRTQFCDAIVRQMRSPHSHLKMFLHLATQHGTMLLEMASQSASVGSERYVILIGREVSSGLAGLVVDQSSAAPLEESASDGDDVAVGEITNNESTPNNSVVVLENSGSRSGATMSIISDVTLPSGIRKDQSNVSPPCARIWGISPSSNSNNSNAIGPRNAESPSTSASTPNPSDSFETASLPSLPTSDDESMVSTVALAVDYTQVLLALLRRPVSRIYRGTLQSLGI